MSNRLTVLAAEIRADHEAVCQAHKYSAERAVNAGDRLLEAQKLVPAGQWLTWLATETELPRRTAQQYMRLACCVSEGSATVAYIAEAGQNAALKAVNGEDQASATPADWTPDQLERKAEAEAGRCVVSDMHDDCDVALIAWAEANERFVRIDRKTAWGNPFEMPDDGERAEVVGKFSKFYLPHKSQLLANMPALRGKVLGCWCHPEECHGHIIAEIVNRQADGEGTAEQLADQLAEVDG